MTNTPLKIENLRCEHLQEAVAIDEPNPRFSWSLSGDGFNRKQLAYQIKVENLNGDILWDTGLIDSDQTLEHEYTGAALSPLATYTWTVNVVDDADKLVTAKTQFTTGLMHNKWDAQWICVPPSKGARPPEATLLYRNPFRAANVSNFRKNFTLPTAIKSARLYATALGAYRFFINGERVSDDYLTPSFTDYHKRVEYQSYDVAAQLNQGENAIGALLAEGWYAGFLGLDSKKPAGIWGRKPQLSAFLLVELENGQTIRIETDGTWKHFIGGLIYSDMLKGEKFDSRMYPNGWDTPSFNDQEWPNAGTDVGAPADFLCAARAQPVRCTRKLKPKSVKQAPDGAWIFDLGQNMVGFCTAKFKAKTDQQIRLVHAEMLQANGDLYLENLRTAQQEDIYVAHKDGAVEYTPTFTFHGFQYVGIYGLDYQPDINDIEGIVINNDLPEVSTFNCSSKLLNQLYSNIFWGQRGNFVSVPMDCPQRDERLGWTADGQVFAPTAAYNMDISAFYTKWLDDIVDEQSEEGAFPDVAPRANSTNDGAPAWGDAGVILPLLLHDRYGDKRIVERMYQPMKKWIEFIRKHNPDYIRENRNHNNYGDWLYIGQATPNDLVATAYYAWMAKLMSQAATLLNVREDIAYYDALYECIREAFVEKYVNDDGTVGSSSQTSYLLSLFVGLVPESLVQKSVNHLVQNIHDADDKVQIGFLGVRHICPILSQFGHSDLAYKLAMSEKMPSWGYSIVNGATTIWERWDGWTHEHGFQVPNMNSFNHYAYGSVGEWMFEWMGGIVPSTQHNVPNPDSKAYQSFTLRPTLGGDLTHCDTGFISPNGQITSNWKKQPNGTEYTISIPANTSATIELEAIENAKILVNGNPAEANYKNLYGSSRAVFGLGSGDYTITVN